MHPSKGHLLQSAATETGAGTPIRVDEPTQSYARLVVQVEGISDATVTFQATIDDNTWYAIPAMNITTGAVASTTTADGIFLLSVAGLLKVRANITAYVSGTITVSSIATQIGTDPLFATQSNDDIVVDVTPTLDTNAYADGDLLFNPVEIPNAVRYAGHVAVLQTVTLLDKTDQGVALDLIFSRVGTSLGTFNAAFAPTDALADEVCGVIEIVAADFVDFANSQLVTKDNVGQVMQAAAASTSLYVAGISRGTGTYAADGITMKLGFLRS